MAVTINQDPAAFWKNTLAVPRPLLLLMTLTLLRGLLYLSIFPPFLGPDEAAHFEAIRMIGQEKKWPTRAEYAVTPMHPDMDPVFEKFNIWSLVGRYSPTRNQGITDRLFIHYYPPQLSAGAVIAGKYLLLYHAAIAPLLALMASLDLVTQVYVLRFVSVLLVTLTILVTWLTIRLIFPLNERYALAATAFIVFWPMHSHVTASINSDAAAELITSVFLLVLLWTYIRGISVLRNLALLVVLTLAILTKPTTLFLLPTLVLAFILFVRRKLSWSRRSVGILILGLLIFTLLASIFLYKNTEGGKQFQSIFSQGPQFPQWAEYVTPAAFAHYLRSLNFAVVSFGGLFGWSNIHIPWDWVRIWAGVIFLAIVGTVFFVYRQLLKPGQRLKDFQKDALIILLGAIIFSLIGIMAPIITTQSAARWAIHSRYYFPVIIPVALFLFLGLQELVPTRFKGQFFWAWLIAWIAYDTLVLGRVIVPYIYS